MTLRQGPKDPVLPTLNSTAKKCLVFPLQFPNEILNFGLCQIRVRTVNNK